MWRPQIDALGDRCRCVVVELPGHGESPSLPGPHTIAGLAAGVVGVLDRLDIDRAHLVGLSIGAMIAMSIAVTDPSRVERLALLCTAARLGPASGWHERAARVRAEGARVVAPAVVGRWLTPRHAAAHPADVASFQEMVASVDAEGYAACCEAIAGMDLLQQLPSITAPTLVVAGAEDLATPVEHGKRIASSVVGARLEVVDGAHLASWERADEVNALLAHHLLGGVSR